MVDEGDGTGAMMMNTSNFKNDNDMIEEEEEDIKLSNNNSTNNNYVTPTNNGSNGLTSSVGNISKMPGIGGISTGSSSGMSQS